MAAADFFFRLTLKASRWGSNEDNLSNALPRKNRLEQRMDRKAEILDLDIDQDVFYVRAKVSGGEIRLLSHYHIENGTLHLK